MGDVGDMFALGVSKGGGVVIRMIGIARVAS
jgi:hypothetical protein